MNDQKSLGDYSAAWDGLWKLGIALLVSPTAIASIYYLDSVGAYDPFHGYTVAFGITLAMGAASFIAMVDIGPALANLVEYYRGETDA